MVRTLASILTTLVVAGATACGNRDGPTSAPATDLPPVSLARLYPPASDRPVFLLENLAMARAFVKLATAVEEGNDSVARGALTDLSDRYRAIADRVPEWAHYVRTDALEALASTLAGPKEEFGRAMGRFDAAACAPCHEAERRNVWYVFSWRNHYADLVVTDPVTGTEPSYRDFMFRLAFSMERVGLSLADGRPEAAARDLEEFRSRLVSLRASCVACHGDSQRALLTREVLADLTRLGEGLAAGRTEPVGPAMQALGQRVCYACHLVHSPAADVQRRWARARAGQGQEER